MVARASPVRREHAPLTREERRARRAARRAKQREANVGRAAAMHAARVRWEREGKVLAPPRRAVPPARFQVGCSGWFYWHWRGGFYPADLPTARWFAH